MMKKTDIVRTFWVVSQRSRKTFNFEWSRKMLGTLRIDWYFNLTHSLFTSHGQRMGFFRIDWYEGRSQKPRSSHCLKCATIYAVVKRSPKKINFYMSKYFVVLCLLWNFQYFYWTDWFVTSHGVWIGALQLASVVIVEVVPSVIKVVYLLVALFTGNCDYHGWHMGESWAFVLWD